MNPELPRVHPTPEAMPQIPGGAEYLPDGTRRSMETVPGHEQAPTPAQVEQLTQAAQAMPQVAAPAPVAPTQGVGMVTPEDDTPAVAGDDDLIEKEWVDKVKKIIALTKGNPHDQAKAIAALQADYLKKRYGKILGGGEE